MKEGGSLSKQSREFVPTMGTLNHPVKGTMHTNPRCWTIGRTIQPAPPCSPRNASLPNTNNNDSSQPLNKTLKNIRCLSNQLVINRVPSSSKQMEQVFCALGLGVTSGTRLPKFQLKPSTHWCILGWLTNSSWASVFSSEKWCYWYPPWMVNPHKGLITVNGLRSAPGNSSSQDVWLGDSAQWERRIEGAIWSISSHTLSPDLKGVERHFQCHPNMG